MPAADEALDRAAMDEALDRAAMDEVMKKYDRESNTRVWEGRQKWVVYSLMAAFSLFVIYVTLFAAWLDLIRYPSFLAGVVLIGYLVFPARKGVQKVNSLPWYDWLLMILGTAAFFYVVVNAKDLTVRLGMSQVRPWEIAIAIVGLLCVFELCRRSVGIPILCVAGVFLIYALYYYASAKGLGMGRAVRNVAVSLFYKVQGGGLLNTPVQICSKFIIVFIIFGAFLERTGISQFFIDLANSLVGRFSGGPAKVAVISSALCGMVSGSSVGNTVTTGSVTIPMMKKTGYRGEFAGAVEAAASTGGQIMPPIMGAAAFLMAEYVGVPYSNIIVRAILPAILYFTGIFIAVHLEAKKLGLRGIEREKLPVLRRLLRRIYLLLPLVILVYLVSSGSNTMAFSAAVAILFAVSVANAHRDPLLALVGIAALLAYLFLGLTGWVRLALLLVGIACAVLCMFKKEAVMSPGVFFDALANGAKSSITVAAACAVAGIIGGCITITGLASQIITAVITLSHGKVFIALFFTMLCCIVLGMGVPTTANYCIMASTCAPILIQLGIPTLAAHFFVFYFGIVADITPPVALAAYAGSAIAKAPPMKTAVNASKLAIGAFIVPYIFAMNPAMLLIDTSAAQVALVVVSSLVGIFGVAAALNGFLFRRIGVIGRIVLAAGGLLMMDPNPITDLVGVVLLVAVALWQYLGARKAKAAV
ncbi:MAG: TRAP transporter fused permease subunit [Oscillospiraceae bacterium]|nr:TRAP transporter fused permease subunit [Oscillospiraceae bacterium]